MKRRKFSRDFKVERLSRYRERGMSVAQAGRDFDVHENLLPTLGQGVRFRLSFDLQYWPPRGRGKGRLYDSRFLQMCSHYLVKPVASTPASGGEKGEVKNHRLDWLGDASSPRLPASLTPRRVAIHSWSIRRSGRCSKSSAPSSSPYAGRFDASMRCRCRPRRPAWCASITTNTRSQPVRSGPVQAYADRIAIRQDGALAAVIPSTTPGLLCAGARSQTRRLATGSLQGLGAAGRDRADPAMQDCHYR